MKLPSALRAAFLLALAANASALAGPRSSAAFKKLQSLAGDWAGKDEKGAAVQSTFKLIVSNTAVMETVVHAGMDEMVTVYSLDGDAIALIHFCPTNNQPRMRATPAGENVKELVFDFQGATNLPSPNTGHQHHLVMRFEDENHITEVWTWREEGKDIPTIFHLERKK